MDSLTRVKIKIQGSDYNIVGDEREEHINELAAKLDDKISKLLEKNPRINLSGAAILSALDYANDAYKSNRASDNLRSQIKDYLEDSAKARIEVEEAKREIDKLRRDIKDLRAIIAEKEAVING